MGANSLVVFLRSVLLVVVFGAIFVFCSAASLRRGEGAAGAGVRAVASLVVPSTALALLSLFNWPLALGISLLVAWVQGAGSVATLRARLSTAWASLSVVTKVAVFVVGVAAAFRAGQALALPPLDGDSLLYHLPITAALVQDHGMWFTRVLLYPSAAELAEAAAGATLGHVSGIAVFQLAQLLVFALIGFGWARRAGASVDGAASTAVVAVSVPIVVDQMFTSQNDIFICAMIASGCVLWRHAPRLAAIGFGLVFAAKVTAFAIVPAVAVVMLVFEGWPFGWADVAWAVALAAPWYVRTWVLAGSPVSMIASKGWSSTIAANFQGSARFIVPTLRTYGGLASLLGVVALIFSPALRGRNSFARALPWLAIASFVAWIVLPNTAESVPGTLDQIRQGWSLRYALLLPFVLATAVPIVLDRVSRMPLAAFIGLIAAASAVVRSANLTASISPLGFEYAAPLLVAAACAFVAFLAPDTRASSVKKPASGVAGVACAAAIALWGLTSVFGVRSVQALWDAAYIQWSLRIPMNVAELDPRIKRSDKLAVIGLRSFPFVGPTFSRRTYEAVIPEPPTIWLARLRREGVPLLVAGGETGSPDEPGFLKPLPLETWAASAPGVCRLATYGYVRIYGLDQRTCA